MIKHASIVAEHATLSLAVPKPNKDDKGIPKRE